MKLYSKEYNGMPHLMNPQWNGYASAIQHTDRNYLADKFKAIRAKMEAQKPQKKMYKVK